jgi:dTDP-glucose pyrophosphorylase
LSHVDVTTLILSAGKIPSELEEIFGSIPSGLIPINGKPVIFRIIDKLSDEGFTNISITVGFKKNNLVRILEQHYGTKIKLNFITVDHTKAPGNSIAKSLEHIKDGKLLVLLGDTLVEDNLFNLVSNVQNFVLTSRNFVNSEDWCIVKQKNDTIDAIYDKKPRLENNDSYALIGIYFFDNSKTLKEIVKNIDLNKRIEISQLLESYRKHLPISTIESKQWYDVGHKNTYYVSKKKLLQGRFFNYLEYDGIKGTVTKTSKNKDKLISEIRWYEKIPDEIKQLTPNILEYSYSDNPYIKLEHIGSPTLAELWLYGDVNYESWQAVIRRLFEVIGLFEKYKNPTSYENYKQIYIDKTEQRISNLISSNEKFRTLFDNDIIINGITYTSWNKLKGKIFSEVKNLFNDTDNCFIHGDLCFSNILYDLNNDKCKLIDPRGSWGSDVYGDIKYDIAKLRHSIVGGYDAIISGLFSVDYKDTAEINMNIFKPENYQKVSAYFDEQVNSKWNLNQVKMIEGLLFISMLPLHKDSFEKQLTLYSVGIQRLNEIVGTV